MARPVVHLLVVVAAVVAGTACSVQVVGTPSAAPVSSPPGRELRNPDRIAAADALGDLTTWDPCSVVNPDTLRGVTKAWLDERESLDYCRITVDTGKGRAFTTIGWLYKASALDLKDFKSETRDGGLKVVSAGHKGRACVRYLVFDDDVSMSVETYPEGDDPAVDLCGVSDVVVDHVIEAVPRGRAESFDFAQNSIGRMRACDEVGNDIAAKVPGLERSESVSGLSGHQCRWRVVDEFPELSVRFHIGYNPSGRRETLAGRDANVASNEVSDQVEKSSLCTVTGEHIRFQHRSGEKLNELVSITVLLPPGQAEAACDGARAVAAELFPKLPRS